MRISDWSSDVCSSDLLDPFPPRLEQRIFGAANVGREHEDIEVAYLSPRRTGHPGGGVGRAFQKHEFNPRGRARAARHVGFPPSLRLRDLSGGALEIGRASGRESVCQYVLILVVAVTLKKKNNK